MSSSNNPRNQRSSSSRSSRRTENEQQVQANRSRSMPRRQVIIILTNNPEILRHSRDLQPQDQGQVETTLISQNGITNHPTTHEHDRQREQVLQNLLQVELREATRDYLSRTRRSYPIHYVFKLSDTEF